ncbi:MAG: lanthionine synthetase C family protein [Algibacter sp.]
MNKNILEKKLKEIDSIIKVQYKNENQIGVLTGLSGISLFQFYYSKYLGIDEHADIGIKILENSINKINEGYNFSTYCTGIAGAGWVLDHLKQENFIDTNSDSLLSELDDFLHEMMIKDMRNGNYDFLHGAIGYTFYFLNRYKNTKSNKLKENYKTILLEFIDLLEGISDRGSENNLRWLSVLNRETGEKGYNLSLSHGMSSIIGILTKLFEHEDFKINTEITLKKTISYILSFKNEDNNSFSLFPSLVSENGDIDYKSRLAWCYGDLGIGIRFWYAGKAIKDKNLCNTAISIMKHAAYRITPESNMVVDAGVCHGSYGNAQIFHRMFKETNNFLFKEATEFWIQDGINKATYNDGYAGYKQWKGGDKQWESEISLLEGIAGIGLTIIDYLADFDTNWDECLMIS